MNKLLLFICHFKNNFYFTIRKPKFSTLNDCKADN